MTEPGDADLLRLDFEFHAAFVAMDAAADRVEEFEKQGRKKLMLAAEGELEKLTEAAAAIARQILASRASTPAGMMVKLSVNDTWSGTYEDDELLESFVADIRAIAGGAS
jgi:hypothetical protein